MEYALAELIEVCGEDFGALELLPDDNPGTNLVSGQSRQCRSCAGREMVKNLGGGRSASTLVWMGQ